MYRVIKFTNADWGDGGYHSFQDKEVLQDSIESEEDAVSIALGLIEEEDPSSFIFDEGGGLDVEEYTP